MECDVKLRPIMALRYLSLLGREGGCSYKQRFIHGKALEQVRDCHILWYPAKRALSVMCKHDGYDPFGRIPSIYSAHIVINTENTSELKSTKNDDISKPNHTK